VLHLLDRPEEIAQRLDEPAAPTVHQMLQQGVNTPLTSSMGRWFDAAAGLLGVRHRQSYEGQAPMLLEGLAARHGTVPPLADGWTIGDDGTLDLLPLAAALLEISGPARGAALFHATLTEALAEWVLRASREQRLTTVVFGGGCFMNQILARGLRARLAPAGLAVFEAAQAPPNDGGLALGQAWVAQRAATAGVN